jgi:hypothetical protein
MRLGEMTLPIPGRRRQTSTKVDPFVTTKLSLFPQNQERPESIPCGILYSSQVEVEAVQLSLECRVSALIEEGSNGMFGAMLGV